MVAIITGLRPPVPGFAGMRLLREGTETTPRLRTQRGSRADVGYHYNDDAGPASASPMITLGMRSLVLFCRMMKTFVLSMLALMILGCVSGQGPLGPRQRHALEEAAQRVEQDKAREAAASHPALLQEQLPGKAASPALSAAQPMSVSSLLKAGGRQLGATELRELLKGARWDGPLPGGWYRTQFLSDGRYHNTLLSKGEKNMDSHGFWYVDPQGRVCSQPANEAAEPRCSVWFHLKNQYYVGASNEASAHLIARKLIK